MGMIRVNAPDGSGYTEVMEHPILFNPEMVRAVLAGTKTQTRRVVTESNTIIDGHGRDKKLFNALALSMSTVDPGPSPAGNPGPYLKAPNMVTVPSTMHRLYPPYQVGDQLWVRENTQEDCKGSVSTTIYQADNKMSLEPWDYSRRVRPSIHMKRTTSRIRLQITSVRVERVQDISYDDAIAEGLSKEWDGSHYWYRSEAHELASQFPQKTFRRLWDSINAKRAPWESNPWVWVFEFKVIS